MAADAPAVRKRPRRTRFTQRRTPIGSELGSASSATEPRTSGDPVWVLPAMYPPPPAPKDDRDPDERVDDLELGGGATTFSTILGERLAPALEYPKRTMSFLLTSPGRLTLAAVVLLSLIHI